MTTEAPWYEKLDYDLSNDGSRKYRATLSNWITMLSAHPQWEGKVRWNEFTHQVELVGAAPWAPRDGESGPWQDRWSSIGVPMWFQDQRLMAPPPDAKVDGLIAQVAHKQRYHPVRKWLQGLPAWDGLPRLAGVNGDWTNYPPFFARYMDLEPETCVSMADWQLYVEQVSMLWFCGAVRRALTPGIKWDYLVVLEGPKGVGKQRWAREGIVPVSEWYCDSKLNFGKIEDAYRLVEGVWIFEWAEMSVSAGKIDTVKQFISQAEHRYTGKWQKYAQSFKRGVCFYASTNHRTGYIEDPTGEDRRFLPLRLSARPIDVDAIKADREQIWAEALHYVIEGTVPTHPPYEAEMAIYRPIQRERCSQDPWEEVLDRCVDQLEYMVEYLGCGYPLQASAILEHWFKVPTERMSHAHQKRVRDMLERRGFKLVNRRAGGKQVKGWVRE